MLRSLTSSNLLPLRHSSEEVLPAYEYEVHEISILRRIFMSTMQA